MPIALSLLFVVVPVAAALSLDIDAFAAFFIIFCVIAGLSVADESMNAAVEKGLQARPKTQRVRGPHAVRPASRANRADA
jgi:diacylglycerol kinase